MRWALIELRTNVDGVRASGSSDAVRQGIARDSNRERTAADALAAALHTKPDGVLFPGWTIVANRPPEWVERAATDCTIVFECLLPGSSRSRHATKLSKPSSKLASPTATPGNGTVPSWSEWQTYVLQDGHCVVGPAPQYVAESNGLWGSGGLSDRARDCLENLNQLGPMGRKWRNSDNSAGMLMVCGEVNLVGGGGKSACEWRGELTDAGTSAALFADVNLIANPAHTPTSIQAMRDKRAWLSKGRVLLLTANIYSTRWLDAQGDPVGKCAHQSAAAWVNGRRMELALTADESRFRVLTIDVRA